MEQRRPNLPPVVVNRDADLMREILTALIQLCLCRDVWQAIDHSCMSGFALGPSIVYTVHARQQLLVVGNKVREGILPCLNSPNNDGNGMQCCSVVVSWRSKQNKQEI
jgi:hypothetical protein